MFFFVNFDKIKKKNNAHYIFLKIKKMETFDSKNCCTDHNYNIIFKF